MMQDYRLIKKPDEYLLISSNGQKVRLCTQVEKEAHKLAKRAIRLLNRTNQSLQ